MKIVVDITNPELNVLEDLLFCENTKEEVAQLIKKVKKVWIKLVKAYDKKKIQ